MDRGGDRGAPGDRVWVGIQSRCSAGRRGAIARRGGHGTSRRRESHPPWTPRRTLTYGTPLPMGRWSTLHRATAVATSRPIARSSSGRAAAPTPGSSSARTSRAACSTSRCGRRGHDAGHRRDGACSRRSRAAHHAVEATACRRSARRRPSPSRTTRTSAECSSTSNRCPTPPGMTYAHWTIIAASGTRVPGRDSGERAASEGQEPLRRRHGQPDRRRDRATGRTRTTTRGHAPTPCRPGQWICLEWMHKGDTSETQFWWDGDAAPVAHDVADGARRQLESVSPAAVHERLGRLAGVPDEHRALRAVD